MKGTKDMSRKKEGLTDEKMRKIAAGATVAGVLLVLFLVIILIIQFVQIGVSNSQSKQLDEAIARYEQMIAEGKEDIDFSENGLGLYYLALKQGWITPSN